ncbi:MAG: aminoglycoside phosphotransferase family protein [Myxococcota bacterium]|nr:aminoglycoside phosphotransferase family protein [Myxococcota bacterium]
MDKDIRQLVEMSLMEHGRAVHRWKALVTSARQEQSDIWIGFHGHQPMAVVKRHHHASKARHEWITYDRLQGPLSAWLPPRYGFIEHVSPLLLLAWQPPWTDTSDVYPTRDAYEHGSFLRALHAVEHQDTDQMSPRDALHLRFSRVRAATPSLCTHVVERVASLLAMGTAGSRVFCHRDFTARNWRRKPTSGGLCVIDWGQARADVAASDFVHLVPAWLGRPDAYTQFIEGYGRAFDSGEVAWILGVMGLHGMASVAWGERHNSAVAYRDGLASLEYLANHPYDDRFL